jgi:fructosamine-3-kinase
MDWQSIEASISRALGAEFEVRAARPVSGGCINDAWCLEDGDRRYFVKLNEAALADMFAAESAGLSAIRETAAILCPAPLCHGSDGKRSWLVLDYLELSSPRGNTSAQLGERLAALHRHTRDRFGFDRDNYIGATRQTNGPESDWVAFLSQQRIGFQVDLARKNGASNRLVESGRRLQEGLSGFFDGYSPVPSLLHGDLWGGNWGATPAGEPVIFDPAVHYGDREADIAMTELFGGFDERFYQSYRQSWSLDPGYETRKVLYNLYHILNHYNLFGGGYAAQAQGMIDSLLAELS